MRRRLALSALLTLVVLASCGGDDDATVAAGDAEGATSTSTTTSSPEDTTGSSTPGPTAPGTVTRPGTATTRPGTGTTPATVPPATTAPAPVAGLAVQIRTGGGFVPVELNFTNTPEFTLYADGRVIATGPTTLEYPGAALPNLLEGRVNTQAVVAAVKSARSAGVFDKPDLGRPPIADAATTTFTVVDGDHRAVLDAYALGFGETFGLTPAQLEARRKLEAFRDEMTNLGGAARDAYRASALSVLVQPHRADQGSPEPAPGQADWPLGELGAGGVEQYGGRCLGFTGADAQQALAAAATARANTRWRSGGKEWSLSFRPELPGVASCVPPR
ncbi:MAG: hypothetical protein ACRD0N_00420 [Acidimicrobiales bacterium]